MKRLLVTLVSTFTILMGLTMAAPSAFACTEVGTACPHNFYNMATDGVWHQDSTGRDNAHILVWLDYSGFSTHANWRNRALDAIDNVRAMTTADNTFQIVWAGNLQGYSGYASTVTSSTPGDCDTIGANSTVNIYILRDTFTGGGYGALSCHGHDANGFVNDADTWIDDNSGFNWNVSDTLDSSKTDLEGVITHELLHDLGFWGHWGDNNHLVDASTCSHVSITGYNTTNAPGDSSMCVYATNLGSFYERTPEHNDIAEYKDGYGL